MKSCRYKNIAILRNCLFPTVTVLEVFRPMGPYRKDTLKVSTQCIHGLHVRLVVEDLICSRVLGSCLKTQKICLYINSQGCRLSADACLVSYFLLYLDASRIKVPEKYLDPPPH